MKKNKEIIRKILEKIPDKGIWNACVETGIHPATFWRWRQKSKELDKQVEATTQSRIQKVEDALYKKAIAGDVTAMIFILTNRAPERWRDRRAVITNQISFAHITKIDVEKIRDKSEEEIVKIFKENVVSHAG